MWASVCMVVTQGRITMTYLSPKDIQPCQGRNSKFLGDCGFLRIAPPRIGEKYDQKVSTSIVAKFNRAQREMDQGTCGPKAASEWLKTQRPKVALHPNMTDYCDTCENLKQEISRHQAILNLYQSGSTSESDLHACKETKQHLEEEMKRHKEVSTKAREYYKSCRDKYN